ncbi:hypothetical protein C8R44DRAFT_747707 [Mycena epipterygia]|nr:hypothetical protein C8R44DRAFT_747707 [Mycena epipterygia]
MVEVKKSDTSQQHLDSNKDLGVNINIRLCLKETPCAHYTTLLSNTRSTADQVQNRREHGDSPPALEMHTQRNARREKHTQSHGSDVDFALSWGRESASKKRIGCQHTAAPRLERGPRGDSIPIPCERKPRVHDTPYCFHDISSHLEKRPDEAPPEGLQKMHRKESPGL